MAESYYLLDHPNRHCAQYGWPRRHGMKLSGVIDVHTAESAPDWVGPDTSAEQVARWIAEDRTDPGSYHDLIDSDSYVPMAPTDFETWHDRFTNPHAVGISFATKAHLWPQLPAEHRMAMLRRGAARAAHHARHIKRTRGIDVPARWLTQAQAHAGVPGFVRHGTSDPGRRSDPWPADAPEAGLFLELYRQEMAGTPAPPTPTESEDDPMLYLIRSESGAVSVVNGDLSVVVGLSESRSIGGFTEAGVETIQLYGEDYARLVEAARRNK